MHPTWLTAFCLLILLGFINIPTNCVAAQRSSQEQQPWFYGGSLGASFGEVQYIEISPLVGYYVNPRTTVGLSFLFRNRKDTRFHESFSTNDYGATLFSQYYVTPVFYMQIEYEYINHEFGIVNHLGQIVGKERVDFTGFFAGGGIRTWLNATTSMHLAALYNFNYNDRNSPYTTPISIRFGIGIGI